MKVHVGLFFLILAMLVGCTSTPSSGGADADKFFISDIYKAKIGLCKNPYKFDDATRLVGLARDKSPEERHREKQNAWEAWLEDIKTANSSIRNKLFVISHGAAFSDYDEKSGYMYINFDQAMYGPNPNTYIQSAVPIAINYQEYETYFYPQIYPENFYKLDDLKREYWEKYKDRRDLRSGEYNLFRYKSKSQSYVKGSYEDELDLPDSDLFFGVWLDTSDWYKIAGSPIIESSAGFVLDTKKFNFLNVFEVYPDTGTVFVKISYLFEFSECVNNTLTGTLKEVILEARSAEPSMLGPYTFEEFYRVTL